MKEGVDKATDIAVTDPYWNPRETEEDGIRELIRRVLAEDSRGITCKFVAINVGGKDGASLDMTDCECVVGECIGQYLYKKYERS